MNADGLLTAIFLAVIALILVIGTTVSWPVAIGAGLIALIALGGLASLLIEPGELDDDYDDEEGWR